MNEALVEIGPDQPFGTRDIMRRVGELLAKQYEGRGILQSAAKKDIPVYIPAFTDSEIGMDVYTYNELGAREGRPPVKFDPMCDLDHFLRLLSAAKRLGIFTIGGGVPRNWAQQAGPLAELLHFHSGGPRRRSGFAIAMRYASAPNPCIGAGLAGQRIPKACPGASSSRKRKAAASPRSTATQPSLGRSSSAPSSNAWAACSVGHATRSVCLAAACWQRNRTAHAHRQAVGHLPQDAPNSGRRRRPRPARFRGSPALGA